MIMLGFFNVIPLLYRYWLLDGLPTNINTWITGFLYSYILSSLLYWLILGAYKAKITLEEDDYQQLLIDLEKAKRDLKIAKMELEIHELDLKIQQLKDSFNESLKSE